ncbi:hypothetical protein CQJ94_20165 [Glycomyces fuscus]|nr:hypothetical protein CQJ94_20165 [Glycomyces fuscus]
MDTAVDEHGAVARHGAFFGRRVGQVLQEWLHGLPGVYHLFHDLAHLARGSEAGEGAGVDHLVLTGAGWLLVGAQECGAGILGTDARGRGRLTTPGGETVAQPWMDTTRLRAQAEAARRLTHGKEGELVWVVPHQTGLDALSVVRARLFEHGGTMCGLGRVVAGSLAPVLPAPEPVDSWDVERLAGHLAAS